MRMIGPAACVVLLQGCSSPPADPLHPPRDFAISLSIQSPVARLEPAWFVVQPDGVLRAVSGLRNPQTPLPPVVRQLTPGERQRLWQAVHAAGWFDDPLPAGYTLGPEVLDGSKIASVAVGGVLRRRTMTVAEDLSAISSMKSVDAVLRELSWLDQE